MPLKKGCVQIYTGEGKGKTTAALGQAFRALGRGMKVLIVQFMKAPDTSGEHFSARAFDGQLKIAPCGRKGLIKKRGRSPEDVDMAGRALEKARQALTAGDYDLVILDEVNVALHMGLIELPDLIDLIGVKPDQVELILTGRYAHADVMALADLVSVIQAEKHYYDRGVPAREGIEY